MKDKNNLSNWNWFEGTVNTENDHIKITYGDSKYTIALIEPVGERSFKVQFLMKPEDTLIDGQKIIDEVRQELDFYLVDLRERKPWEYAKYHCGTAANIYSNVHWGYYPKGFKK